MICDLLIVNATLVDGTGAPGRPAAVAVCDDSIVAVGASEADLPVGEDLFSWELRRVGPGVAWSLDLTACLVSDGGAGLGALLRELTTVLRHHGLIPVTIERFA